MKRNVGIMISATVVWGIVISLIATSEPVDHYVSVMQQYESGSADSEALRKQIQNWKRQHEEAPKNAYLDPVWKAIPGYNGRIVDIEASLANMKKSGTFDESQLVIEEKAPSMQLDQLGAHPVYRGNPNKPAVSFMINVAWGNEHLDKMLKILDKHAVKTTFFFDGSWVHRFPELAKKIVERGHEIGNHAYSHPDMSKLGHSRIRQEIGKTQLVIEKTVGITPTVFAPPSGSFNQSVVQVANAEYKMRTILWTVDTVDWMKPPADQMVQRVSAKLDKGVLVLMHPTLTTAQGLEQLLMIAKKKGLTPTTVSEVLSSKRLD